MYGRAAPRPYVSPLEGFARLDAQDGNAIAPQEGQ